MIACVACLEPNRSIHTATFLRAVELCEQYVCGGGRAPAVSLERFDDAMRADVAARVALEIVARRPRAVVGHFASAAADAAAPCYARAGIPLLLPAATASDLTRHGTTWRVCDPDDAYCAWLLDYCAREDLQPAVLEHDGSLHGRSVVDTVARLGGRCASAVGGRPARLYAGTYANSVAYATGLDPADRMPLVLTDDAYTPALLREPAIGGREVHVIGFMPRPEGEVAGLLRSEWRRRFGGEPGVYFWETVAAIQIAVQAARLAADAPAGLASRAWPTVLGEVRFGPDRESRPRAFSAFRHLPAGCSVPTEGLADA